MTKTQILCTGIITLIPILGILSLAYLQAKKRKRKTSIITYCGKDEVNHSIVVGRKLDSNIGGEKRVQNSEKNLRSPQNHFKATVKKKNKRKI